MLTYIDNIFNGKIKSNKVALIFIFVNLFNVRLNRKGLGFHICF